MAGVTTTLILGNYWEQSKDYPNIRRDFKHSDYIFEALGCGLAIVFVSYLWPITAPILLMNEYCYREHRKLLTDRK